MALPVALAAQQADPSAAVSLRETAAALIRSGTALGDARAVLAGAQILILAERSATGLQRVDVRQDTARADEQGKIGHLTAASALRLASRVAIERNDVATARAAAELAGNRGVGLGNEALGAELQTAARALETTRGAVGGPLWADGNLSTGETAEFRVTFQGGRVPNRIDVSASNPRADLDCYLYSGSRIVQRDEGYGGSCSVRWEQQFTGTMTLRVRNAGASSYFVLMSN
jgi:hypothetical protein